MDEEIKIGKIRATMPAVQEYAYLNTGTFGPIPAVVQEAMQAAATREYSCGRITLESYEIAQSLKAAARAEVAQLLDCDPNQIALTRHTTDGINLAVMGRNWLSDEEIVTTDMEHPGALGPIFNVARRYGVTIRTVRLGTDPDQCLADFARVITPRTRLVVLSHVTWTTGMILPVREIADLAHQVGALVVIDGAQSAGAVPVNVRALGADVYAIPGQKWLCGPEGTGAVYFSADALDQLQLTIVGYASLVQGGVEPIGGYFLPKPTAERFEVGGVHVPAIAGQVAALRWLREEVSFDWIYTRIHQLGQFTVDQLSHLKGVSILTPRDHMAGLVTVTVESADPQRLVEELHRRKIIVRWITRPYAVRVSTGFYNTEEDILALVEAVQQLRQ